MTVYLKLDSFPDRTGNSFKLPLKGGYKNIIWRTDNILISFYYFPPVTSFWYQLAFSGPIYLFTLYGIFNSNYYLIFLLAILILAARSPSSFLGAKFNIEQNNVASHFVHAVRQHLMLT